MYFAHRLFLLGCEFLKNFDTVFVLLVLFYEQLQLSRCIVLVCRSLIVLDGWQIWMDVEKQDKKTFVMRCTVLTNSDTNIVIREEVPASQILNVYAICVCWHRSSILCHHWLLLHSLIMQTWCDDLWKPALKVCELLPRNEPWLMILITFEMLALMNSRPKSA